MVKGQSAPIYWIFFATIIFGILMMVTFLSPMIETIGSLGRNMTADLPLNGSVNTTINRWNSAFNIVPIILIVGLLLAMIIVAQKREFDSGRVGYA